MPRVAEGAIAREYKKRQREAGRTHEKRILSRKGITISIQIRYVESQLAGLAHGAPSGNAKKHREMPVGSRGLY
jgi:hypothetical protein